MFLFINNLWLRGAKKDIDDYFVNLAIRVARSKPQDKDTFLKDLGDWLEGHTHLEIST